MQSTGLLEIPNQYLDTIEQVLPIFADLTRRHFCPNMIDTVAFVSTEYRLPLSCLITKEQKEQGRSKHNGQNTLIPERMTKSSLVRDEIAFSIAQNFSSAI